ncbi:MAG TPA: hypothetical protein DDW89_00775 [Gammaproteobacteria bacterium]|nr:hypothetical protein [Gammaproteobacteria bacterium]
MKRKRDMVPVIRIATDDGHVWEYVHDASVQGRHMVWPVCTLEMLDQPPPELPRSRCLPKLSRIA